VLIKEKKDIFRPHINSPADRCLKERARGEVHVKGDQERVELGVILDSNWGGPAPPGTKSEKGGEGSMLSDGTARGGEKREGGPPGHSV